MIDHGAALYFHHGWPGGVSDPARFAQQGWDLGDHVLAAYRGALPDVDRPITPMLTPDVVGDVLAEVPDAWLEPVPGAVTPDAVRAAYVAHLAARLGTRQWLPSAQGGAA